MIDFRSLIDVGIHFGHEKRRWCPKMAPYIWGSKNNIHLVDVSKTAYQLEKAAKFLEQIAAEGKTILWVGTKKPAQDAIYQAATRLNMPYVNHRWVGGTLSNFIQVKKSVTKLLHYEDVVAKTDKFPHYTKKEINVIQKNAERLRKNVGGIIKLSWPVGAIVIIDAGRERAALREAVSVGVPVIALVDTNCDPSYVDYVIPGNDDAPRAISFVVDYLSEAAGKGAQEAAKAAVEQKKIEDEKRKEAAAQKAAKKTSEKQEKDETTAVNAEAKETSSDKKEAAKKSAPGKSRTTTSAKKPSGNKPAAKTNKK